MIAVCAWRNGSTGEDHRPQLPDRCKSDNCSGIFRRKQKQIAEMRRICPNFLPDVETIMKTKTGKK